MDGEHASGIHDAGSMGWYYDPAMAMASRSATQISGGDATVATSKQWQYRACLLEIIADAYVGTSQSCQHYVQALASALTDSEHVSGLFHFAEQVLDRDLYMRYLATMYRHRPDDVASLCLTCHGLSGDND